ncbi:hypothetical protein CDAR_445951 [Caerostris darwini]|uniref:Uncharacterized protein n=1 Tax=Caerostris darwini TaxID=1538125 RepID=A0AAV4U0I8_9ARAC|nr:hypothetical protein CDAR_445951 [Caerostris darwini]
MEINATRMKNYPTHFRANAFSFKIPTNLNYERETCIFCNPKQPSTRLICSCPKASLLILGVQLSTLIPLHAQHKSPPGCTARFPTNTQSCRWLSCYSTSPVLLFKS